MKKSKIPQDLSFVYNKYFLISSAILLLALAIFFILPEIFGGEVFSRTKEEKIEEESKQKIVVPVLDKTDYDRRMNLLANNPPPPPPKTITDANGVTTTIETLPPNYLWPVKNLPYPNGGAILPFNRIIAYYGNLYSRKMGVLGEYDEAEMFARLKVEVDKWNVADPTTRAIPALHYIAVVAQGGAGADGKYRARMPEKEIDKVIEMAKKIDALVFLDIQVGFSNLQTEVPLLEKYLKMPEVHLGIDAEFSMKGDIRPGKIVGTLDASDINFSANYLAKIVKENNLTPKILVVHRYTQKMVTNYKLIKPLPEVQIVMHMDGWGGPAHKISTYKQFVFSEPVQFTGFKLFYKNDLWPPSTEMLVPEELLELRPKPVYIRYQ